jgi:Tfp pilus assembly protein PilX
MRAFNTAKRQEQGMASIVVVGLLVILLTLITLGFAKIMGRSVQNSTSNETAASASYAAQSGLNDVTTYLKTNLNVKATKCNDLIGTSANKGPFYDDSNISGDNNTRYTCLLVNQQPTDLAYQNIANMKSKVVKLTTNAVTGSIDSFMFSWEARDNSKTSLPNTTVGLLDEATWNNANYVPMLRVTLYPVTTSGALDDNVQSNSRTFFLSPANGGGPGSKTFDYSSTADGSRKHIQCDKTQVSSFTGTSDTICNVVITGLENVTNIDYFYARITPIYNNINLIIKGNDIDNRAVKFKNVQAVVDVTAKSGPAAKRLQSRIDISGIDTSGSGSITPSDNLSSSEDSAPDYSLRSANSLCKRWKITNDVYDYLTVDGACPNVVSGGGGGIFTPPPTLAMNVNGVDSQTDTPPSSGYKGTSYISTGGSAQINWSTTDATSCIASGNGWSGEKKGIMGFTPTGVGTGSQTFSGLTDVANYTLTCSGPGSGVSPGIARTVTAWPPPRVSFNNTSVTAGQNYSLSWNVANATNCSASGAWSGTKSSSVGPATFSAGQGTWAWNDNSTKTFIITCTDPSSGGRPVSAQITLGPGQSNNCGGSSSCSNNVNPPPCSADPVSFTDNGNGTGTMSWNGSCPTMSPGSGYYQLINCVGAVPCGFVGNAATANLGSPGTYCAGLMSGADPWGWLASSGQQCITIADPPIVLDAVYVGSTSWWRYAPCGDGLHSWVMCQISINVHQNGAAFNQVHCQAKVNGSAAGSGNSGVYIPMEGWPPLGPDTGPEPVPALKNSVSFHCWSDRNSQVLDWGPITQ